MRILWAALAVSLSACTCGGDVCAPTGATAAPTGFATANQPVTVTILHAISCGERVPTSVLASVLDPDTMSTPGVTATAPAISLDGFSTDVSFVPTKPGPYHLTVRFEPSLGVAQGDLIVAAERRDAGFVSLAQPCARGDLTPGGLVLCVNGAVTQVYSGPTRVQTFFGIAARAQGTLWVADGGLERWVEDAGAFELTARASAPKLTGIIPAVDDALAVAAAGADVLRWVDGGLVDTGLTAPAGDVMFRAGDEVVTVTQRNPGPSPMGGWCLNNLVDAGTRCSAQELQKMLPTAASTADSTGIWFEANVTAFELYHFDATAFDQFSLPGDWRMTTPTPVVWDNGVLLSSVDAGVSYVVTKTPTGLRFDNYGAGVRSVTGTAVTVSDGPGGVRVYRR